MNADQAEQFTQALGQIASGAWRQVALAQELGVPEALGLTTREWVEQRLGGYLRLSIDKRRDAVGELTSEGMTTREIGDVLGVDHKTVVNDRHSGEFSPKELVDQEVFSEGAHAICPTCGGAGVVPVEAIGGVTK